MVEFALVFILFISIIIGFFNISFAIWFRATLDFAARQGVRYGITGATRAGMGHIDSIRAAVQESSGGLLDAATIADVVDVKFYNADGAQVSDNTGGNLVEVSIPDHPLPRLSSALLFSFPDPMTVSVSAVGRLEPYPIPPAL